MQSYATQQEIDALQASKLSRATPFIIKNISASYFSVARHTGGLSYNGFAYVYHPPTDECVRDDVLKFITKLRKLAVKTAADLPLPPHQKPIGLMQQTLSFEVTE